MVYIIYNGAYAYKLKIKIENKSDSMSDILYIKIITIL